MLIHLPIIILTSPHPTPIADVVPKFEIARECQLVADTGGISSYVELQVLATTSQPRSLVPIAANDPSRITQTTSAAFLLKQC
jgi:hypothetical protein